MGPRDLLRRVSEELTRLRVRHFVTGSMGSMAYGEYRSTVDVDLVAEVQVNHVRAVVEAFPGPDFYLSEEAMLSAIRSHGQFNLIHVPSAMKVDFMIPESSAFNASRFARIRDIPMEAGFSVPVASPEDIILMKLRYYQMGGSDKHLRDSAGILRILGAEVDRAYVTQWSQSLGVLEEWQALLARAG